MKLLYISKNKRRYLSLGKEFPNKKDPSANEIDVDNDLGKILLRERVGRKALWQEAKAKRSRPEITEEVT